MSAARSASGAGVSPASPRAARMNRSTASTASTASTGVDGQAASSTAGGSAGWTGCQAQWARRRAGRSNGADGSGGSAAAAGRLRPRRAHLDPSGQGRDVVGGQGPGRRHQHGAAVQALHQGALGGTTRHDGRPRIASGQQRLAAVEPEPAERRVDPRAVARVAVVGQQRADGGFEELRLLGIRRRLPGGRRDLRRDGTTEPGEGRARHEEREQAQRQPR